MQLKMIWYNFLTCICLLFLSSCGQKKYMLTDVKTLPYPSGSAITFLHGKLYLMGDDAVEMLVLDENLNITDSIPISDYPAGRIPKSLKPDIESIANIIYQKQNVLLLLGSGSAVKHRNAGYVIQPLTAQKKIIDLSLFYERLKSEGIKDLNIEAVAALPGGLVMASRGNKNFRRNFLIFTKQNFFDNQDTVDVKLVRIGTNADTSLFNGISGLDYAAGADKLILTISSENTFNSYDDGTIGKSYLWIINDITTRKRISHINPDVMIDLEEIDDRFKGHKIESVSIFKETRERLYLFLAADDDNGQTLLFKFIINK